jgi:hypothetical protein
MIRRIHEKRQGLTIEALSERGRRKRRFLSSLIGKAYLMAFLQKLDICCNTYALKVIKNMAFSDRHFLQHITSQPTHLSTADTFL